MIRKPVIILVGLLLGAALRPGQAQSPVVVQAASPSGPSSTTSAAAPSSVSANTASNEAAIRTLEKIKTANEEILRRQEAALQQLDEMQQAAEQLKIFSKRG